MDFLLLYKLCYVCCICCIRCILDFGVRSENLSVLIFFVGIPMVNYEFYCLRNCYGFRCIDRTTFRKFENGGEVFANDCYSHLLLIWERLCKIYYRFFVFVEFRIVGSYTLLVETMVSFLNFVNSRLMSKLVFHRRNSQHCS